MGKKLTIVAVALGIAALVFSGCDSERSLLDFNFGKSKSKTDTPASDAVDIFDEFYMSEGEGGGESAETDSSAAVAVPTTRFQRQQAAARAGSTPPPAKAAPTAAARPAGSFNFSPRGRYVVQVNSTPLRRDADRMVDRLKSMGFPAYIAETENPTQELFGIYYRVRIGGFDAYSEAQAFGEEALVPAGFRYWVDRRANDRRAGVSFSAPPQGASGSAGPWPTPAPESQPSASQPAASQPESIVVEVAPVQETEQRGDGW
ncbi:MAG: SPOR domain-containing protein [Chitinispirillales bacterium]|jgi:hypothetical protein|nr:SPOR domain-containing protein [Chitinispirillales bacterium]